MGLFGGFKAKFTRNATPKKQPEVVCLRYHVHAEFDRPDVQIPIRINNDIKKNEVVRNHSKRKERKAITKSAIFPESHTSQSSLSSSPPQKSLSLNNLNEETPSPVTAQENGYTGANHIQPQSHSSASNSTSQNSLSVNNLNGETASSITTQENRYASSKNTQSSVSSSADQKVNNLNGETTSSLTRHENGYGESTNPLTVSTTVTVPNNGNNVIISDTKFGRKREHSNGKVTEKVAMVTNNHVYSTHNNIKSEQHSLATFQAVSSYEEGSSALTNGTEYSSNSYLKPSLTFENSVRENGHKNLDNDQSTLIFMTQHSSRSSSFDRNMETTDINFAKMEHFVDSNRVQENFHKTAKEEDGGLSFVPKHAVLEDDDDYFKVNVVKHDLNRTYSMSEDEHSFQDEEEPHFTRMGFSSQAASIFFGEGEVAEVVRPRRIQLTKDDDDDERRSSGADC